jgi:arsenite methyltransferase
MSDTLRDKVREAYSAAADSPQKTHPFPVGRAFAESLGYPRELLASLPAVSVEAFTGVSNVSLFSNIPKNATVLDLGCGAGLDALIAAQRAGPAGRVVGFDFSFSMLRRARRGAAEAGAANVLFGQAQAENLPLRTGFAELAMVNGIFNLNPAREAVLQELARVVRPGGGVYAAELVLLGALSPQEAASESDWFA